MTIPVAAASKRTFYIERHGDRYEVVKVWERGARMTQTDMAFAFSRVMVTDPDERILAEQSVGVTPGPNGPTIVAEDPSLAKATAEVTERLLRGERLPNDPQDQP